MNVYYTFWLAFAAAQLVVRCGAVAVLLRMLQPPYYS